MCGRYALTTSAEVLAQLFEAAINFELQYRYNIAPTQAAPIVRAQPSSVSENEREIAKLRWGLVPSWAKDVAVGSRMINARSETAATKPAFRSAFKQRRCLVPASGFYEWQKLDNVKGQRARKQPYYIYRADGEPVVMAGLWESWMDPVTGAPFQTYTILTTNANDQLRDLHHRMPVILEPEQFNFWLNAAHDDDASLRTLLKPAADGVLAMHPVSSRINSPKNDDPALIESFEDERDEASEARAEQPGLFSDLEP